MATTMAEAIKRLTWQFTSEGADKVASDHNKIADATDALSKKSQTTEKTTLDLEKSFQSLERRFSSTIRAQQDYSAVQAKVNAAVAQHPELQHRANETLERAKEHFEKAAGGASGFTRATEIARESMIGFAIEGGAMGAILGSFGPWGIAAAAGITVLREAFEFATESAKQFGERSLQIRSFADATGATTTEVRGLAEAGEKAGVGGDRMKVAFERLTVNLAEARTKSGELFEGIQAINPELAEEIANTRNSADAWDLLGRALDKTTDSTLKAKVARTAFGRGGVELIPALAETTRAGGIKEYADEVQHATGVTDELTRATAAQVAEIEALKKLATDTFASIYSEAVLHRMEQAAKFQLQIAQSAQAASKATGGSILAPSADEFGQPFDFTLLNANKTAAGHGDAGHGGGHGATSATREETEATQALTKARLDALEAEKGAAGETARMNALLGGAATGAEIAAANFHKLTAAFLGNKFGAADTAEALEKYQRALHGDTGNQIAALQDQRMVIEAIGGAAKMNAQFQADYNAQLRAGKEPADALALATEKLDNARAAANSGAAEQLFNLQNQAAAAGAVTGAQQIQAQGQATLNSLLRQGVDASLAAAVANQQMANASASASASVYKQTEAVKDSTAMLRAQRDGTETVTAAQIAYKNARESGASVDAAIALKQAVLINGLEREAAAARQAAAAYDQMAQAEEDAYRASHKLTQGTFIPETMPTGPLSFSADPRVSVHYASGGAGKRLDVGGPSVRDFGMPALTPDSVAAQYVGQGDYAAAIKAVEAMQGFSGVNRDGSTSTFDVGAQISQVDTLTQLLNSQTSDKGTQATNLQKEMAWLNTLPETIARDQKIIDLQKSIDQLRSSTDGLNGTMGDLLSPYYSQDPRTSHIGFRSQGMASGGEFTVPGGFSSNDNMIGIIPLASGEIFSVRRPGESKGSSINITNHIVVGDRADKNEIGRTVYQAVQNATRQLRSASQ